MEANQKSNLNIKDYIPQWSANKYQEMKSQLNGYWDEDIWYPADNPLQNLSKGRGAAIRFNKCTSKIKLEIKFACYQKVINKEWSASTLHNNASRINRICEWLGTRHYSSETLLEKSLEQWLISFKTYLVDIGKKPRKQITSGVDSEGKPKIYFGQDKCIYKLTSIYNFIFDFYDSRNEYDKDIWDMRKLGLTRKYVNSSSQHILNFTELKYTWALPAVKKFIKYKISFLSPTTCCHKLLSIKTFFNFLFLKYPHIIPTEISREIVLDYLGYLSTLSHSNGYHRRFISDLRDFFELCFRERWLDRKSVV